MMNIRHKRSCSAWILLLVFVPMLLMSSLHHHNAVTEHVCYECLHHIHHAGHLSGASSSIDNCVLCQFQGLPFVAASAVVLSVFSIFIFYVSYFVDKMHVSTVKGRQSSRAPPYNL